MSSTPIATGGSAFLPGLKISKDSVVAGNLTLDWPEAGGVTYEVYRSLNLQAGSWTSKEDNIGGGGYSFFPVEDREFFQVGIGSNTPPHFTSDPVVLADAGDGVAYVGSLVGKVVEVDSGDTLTFGKVSGPAWLTIASDGTLGGTPPVGVNCPDYFRVSVTDAQGAAAVATLQITVEQAVPTMTADFVVTDDTFSKQNSSTLDAGNRTNIEMRQIGTHSFARVGYFKFAVSGLGTVTQATLHFHSIDEVDPVDLHQVADTTWTENSLNWDNQPTLGSVLGTTTPVANSWFSYDVTSHVTADGTYAFALEEQGDTFQKLTSKEGGQAAYLRVTWETGN